MTKVPFVCRRNLWLSVTGPPCGSVARAVSVARGGGEGQRGAAPSCPPRGPLLLPALALAVGSWVCGIRFQA